MNFRVNFLFLVFLIFIPLTLFAKNHEHKAHWTYEVKKKSSNEYDIIFHVRLKRGWYLNSHSDDNPEIYPPSFTFNKNDKVQFKRGIKHKGMTTKARGNRILSSTTYSGNVDFTQTLIVTEKTTLSGSLEYQLCHNDKNSKSLTDNFVFELGR